MSQMITRAQVEAAADFVDKHSGQKPSVGIVLGSGLNDVAEEIEDAIVIPCGQIPNWPLPTVPGHSGRLIIGKLAGKRVIVQQGRVHFYEGHSMSQVTLPVRVMQTLGVEWVILTNAAGGINRDYQPGDLMLIKDHINLPGISGHNPLRGPNDDTFGPRFPDLTRPYDRELRLIAAEVATEIGLRIHEGVYVCLAGPSFETPAELRFFNAVGADAVGMSTVPSVIAARHAGMRVLAISTITNKSILDPDEGASLSHEEVLKIGNRIVPQLTALIRGVLQRA